MDLPASVSKSSTIRPCSVDVYPLASLSASLGRHTTDLSYKTLSI